MKLKPVRPALNPAIVKSIEHKCYYLSHHGKISVNVDSVITTLMCQLVDIYYSCLKVD